MFGRLKKAASALRYYGQKLASGAQWLGDKVGGAILGAVPVLTAINPTLGAGATAVGGVLEGVGALGGIANSALGGNINPGTISQLRGVVGGIRDDARAVREAYNSFRGPRSTIERRR